MLPLLDDNILLIKPAPGLMIWTLVTFLIVLYILRRVAFGRIAEMLEARRRAVQTNLEAAEGARDEAQKLLDEYRQQLAAARHEASEIVERARRTGEEERRRMQDELQAERERGVAAAKSAIEAETRQSIDRIKSEIADLTLQATEAVLPHEARRRRVQAPDRRGAVRRRLLEADERLTMADAAALPFAEALYEAALAADRLDAVNRDLAAVRGAIDDAPDLARFLANPAFPADAKRRVLDSMTAGGDPLVANFLNVLVSHGRLELLVDAAEAFAERYRREQRELAVSLTTAVPIDDAQADSLRQKLESATGQTVTIRRTVDPSIVGGVVLRVRDLLVDASVRRRLEGLRLSLKASKLPSGGEA